MWGNFYIVKWYDIFPALWSLFVFTFITPPPPKHRPKKFIGPVEPFIRKLIREDVNERGLNLAVIQARILEKETAALARTLQQRQESLPYTLEDMAPASHCPTCKRAY